MKSFFQEAFILTKSYILEDVSHNQREHFLTNSSSKPDTHQVSKQTHTYFLS